MQATDLVRTAAAHFDEADEVPMAALSIAVPYFIVRLTAICVERRELGVLREFILRAIQVGWSTVEEISGFLGIRQLDIQTEIEALTVDLFVASYGSPIKITLMEKGIRAISVNGVTRVQVREVGCYTNGITRRIELSLGDLVPRRKLPADVLVLPAIPARPPRVGELDVNDVKASIMSSKSVLPRIVEVARLGRVVRTSSLYMAGYLLLRRGIHSMPLVCVDGASEPELAGHVGGHPALQMVKASIQKHEFQIKRTISQRRPEMRSAPAVQAKNVRSALTSFVLYADAAPEKRSQLQKDFLTTTDSLVLSSHWLGALEAKMLFARAILCAQNKLIIVVPPLSASLFDFDALESVSIAIKRGVRVEMHVLANDIRFFGHQSSVGSRLKGVILIPIPTEKTWCGFCCDKNFAVIGATKILSSSMGRCETYFGALMTGGSPVEDLLLDLTSQYPVPVVVKKQKKLVSPKTN